MEKDRLTSESLQIWYSGLRIIDLGLLAKQMHCKQCRSLLDLNCVEKEEQVGLGSVLYILCSCGTVNDVYTGKNNLSDGGPIYEVNIKASVFMENKDSVHHIVNFLRLLDIPFSSCSSSTLLPSISTELVPEFPEKPVLSVSSGTSPETPQSLCITASPTSSGSASSIASANKRLGLEASSELSASSQSCEQRSSSGSDLRATEEALQRTHHSFRQLPKKQDQRLNRNSRPAVQSTESLPSVMDKSDENARPKNSNKCPICQRVVPSSRGFLIHMARLHKEQTIAVCFLFGCFTKSG